MGTREVVQHLAFGPEIEIESFRGSRDCHISHAVVAAAYLGHEMILKSIAQGEVTSNVNSFSGARYSALHNRGIIV
jgi:hypothetical protein